MIITKWKDKRDKTLGIAKKVGEVNYTNSNSSKWRAMSACAVSIDSSFMGKNTDNERFEGRRQLVLPPSSVHVLKNFCHKYIPKATGASSDEEDPSLEGGTE